MTPGTNSEQGKLLALTGAIFQLGPFIGLVGTVIGMRRAFQTTDPEGTEQVRELSASIGTALSATAAGLAVGLIGLVLIGFCLFGLRYRAPWLFYFLVIYGAVTLLAFPVGTIIGIALLAFCLANKDQFLAPAAKLAVSQNH